MRWRNQVLARFTVCGVVVAMIVLAYFHVWSFGDAASSILGLMGLLLAFHVWSADNSLARLSMVGNPQQCATSFHRRIMYMRLPIVVHNEGGRMGVVGLVRLAEIPSAWQDGKLPHIDGRFAYAYFTAPDLQVDSNRWATATTATPFAVAGRTTALRVYEFHFHGVTADLVASRGPGVYVFDVQHLTTTGGRSVWESLGRFEWRVTGTEIPGFVEGQVNVHFNGARDIPDVKKQ